jgi:hypothetical protein
VADRLTLTALKDKYGDPPADLTIELRGNKAILTSGNDSVEMGVPFGAIKWSDVLHRYALPALAALREHRIDRELGKP